MQRQSPQSLHVVSNTCSDRGCGHPVWTCPFFLDQRPSGNHGRQPQNDIDYPGFFIPSLQLYSFPALLPGLDLQLCAENCKIRFVA